MHKIIMTDLTKTHEINPDKRFIRLMLMHFLSLQFIKRLLQHPQFF